MAGTSQTVVSRIERGDGLLVSIETIERVVTALAARLTLRVLWQGEALDRLRDEAHAALVERSVRWLVRAGWHAAPEVSFAIYGERGSVDLLAWSPRTRIALVVEVKASIGDVQDLIATLDRKARLARQIARQRDWNPSAVARLLVVGETSTNRRRLAEHAGTFGAAFPIGGAPARSWVRDGCPANEAVNCGLVFLSPSRIVTRKDPHRSSTGRRRA